MSNKLELEFAKYINERGKRIWIRQVLVPGITDKEEDLIKLKEFLDRLNIEKLIFCHIILWEKKQVGEAWNTI